MALSGAKALQPDAKGIEDVERLFREGVDSHNKGQKLSLVFFRLLLVESNWEVFSDIAGARLNKERLFAEINALYDVGLKQNLLCQMLLQETFLGKLFRKRGWFQFWELNVTDGLLETAAKALLFLVETDQKLYLNKEMIKALVKDKALQNASASLQRICERVGLQLCKKADELSSGMLYNAVELDDAIAHYDGAIQLMSRWDIDKAYNNRGNTYKRKGELDPAIADYKRAMELNSYNASARENYSSASFAKEHPLILGDAKPASKKEIAELAALDDAGRGYFYFNRGAAYLSEHKNRLALDDFNKAIELKPDLAEAYKCRGDLNCRIGERDLAFKDFNKAIELKPDYAAAYNNRGTVQVKFDLAIADYSRALELDPKFVLASQNRDKALINAFEKPSEDFFAWLLIQKNWAIFSDIATVNVNKENLLAEIQKLPLELKLNVLCQALMPQTFLGKLFSSHQKEIEGLLVRDEKLRGMLHQHYPALYNKLLMPKVVVVHPAPIPAQQPAAVDEVPPASSMAEVYKRLRITVPAGSHHIVVSVEKDVNEDSQSEPRPAVAAPQCVVVRSKARLR